MWRRMGGGAGSYEHGNEHSGSTIGREFHDQLSDYRLLEKDPAPWS
jgi:hypothetical protein